MKNIRILNDRSLTIKLMLGSLALVGGALWLMGDSAAEETVTAPAPASGGRPALTVRTVALHEDKWAETLSANGSILPWQEAIISSQLQGVRIAAVKVSIGDRVKQGEVLATLDNAIYAAGKASPQGKILAPDDGVISSASANVGSMPKSGDELFRLIRKGRLEWQAELTAEELMRLKVGMKAQVTVGGHRTLKGTVRAISPAVNAKTRYGYALVSLPDSEGIIAGAYAQGTFDISSGKRKLSALPQSTIMRRGSHAYVLVVDEASRVHERAVKLGQRNGDSVEIVQGLQPGEQVVETGGPFLTEGDLVKVLK